MASIEENLLIVEDSLTSKKSNWKIVMKTLIVLVFAVAIAGIYIMLVSDASDD